MQIQPTSEQMEEKAGDPIKALDLKGIAEAMLNTLDDRSKDIVMRRFGLKADKRETLESIGREYEITRERVRQIEVNARKSLSGLEEVYAPAYNFLRDVFTSFGGALAEEHVVRLVRDVLQQQVSPHLVHFYLEILPRFIYTTSARNFDGHWRYQSVLHPMVEPAVEAAQTILKKRKHPIAFSDLAAEARTDLQVQSDELPDSIMEAALVASKNMAPTAFGEWGLVGWAETSPRGVGDKAYTVLRRHGKPAHFRDITEKINEAEFDHKRANPQTVHNELIKDGRFVLVGRGLYGLKEWGYMAGTVADVLESILKEAQAPLSREELIDQVLKQRLVKKNTILLSLQNNERFLKLGKNQYGLKESQI